MKLINQSYKILTDLSQESVQKMKETVEFAARLCYKTEDKTGTNTDEFLSKLWHQNHHESIFEHASVSVHLITNRGVTHELVRHRIASYSQESTRYCNYSKDKFGNELTFIKPVWSNFHTDDQEAHTFNCILDEKPFKESLESAERNYFGMLSYGWTPEKAREVLPNALKTEIVITANWREWKHIFSLRCSEKAHPQIRELMQAIEIDFIQHIGVPFIEL